MDVIYVVKAYPVPGWDEWYEFYPVFFENKQDAETLVERIHDTEFGSRYREYLSESKARALELETHNGKIRRANEILTAAGLEPSSEQIWEPTEPYDFEAWKRVYVDYPLVTVMTVKRGSL